MSMQPPAEDRDDKSLPVGGGLKAVRYVMSIAGEVGPRRLAEAVRSKNTCKACAFGTGGQRGGLHNEHNAGIEICNKNIQAQSSDLRPAIPRALFEDNTLTELAQLSGRELEALGRLAHPLYKGPGRIAIRSSVTMRPSLASPRACAARHRSAASSMPLAARPMKPRSFCNCSRGYTAAIM
jgi:hypothetical protein